MYLQAQFDAIELITQRTLISQRVSELLTERAQQFGLLLDDISIVRETRNGFELVDDSLFHCRLI